MKNNMPWWIRIPVIFFLIFGLMEFAIESGDQPAFIAYPITLFFLLFVLFLLIAIELILRSIENVMYHTLSKEAQQRYLANSSKPYQWGWAKRLLAKMTGNKPVEEEAEIILDHNYDGIKELDNNLPPWWVYMFYASIIFGIVYMARYHIFNGDNQDVEYEKEVAAAQIDIAEYKKNAKGLVDASTVEVLTEASDLKAGEAIYQSNCVACHMADGGGGIGPNLTDDHWIIGGGIKNIFSTISEGGRAGKGMIAWKQSLKPLEIAQVASYVYALHGQTPANPKDPEGEIWTEEP
ncbi:cytochrome c oxidase cbb3-type subunit 3 [Arenibacter nanhaiticus]|uniref:Cytochrome c oxidase cbb3-type subunit 3 n=1 Tax=Arenibacter nanhaiticus TaxID=558155 RepID=A0A1M6IL27_9FLAO|nr:cbb3-type cytochrome c oxidase N-terminal domain-containing protein [Arenibacter nanhaiticus]SHJ35192.1 cytochrome c oxidase cbb3-type subunit 3 [Arenibacter nanhaiticus]